MKKNITNVNDKANSIIKIKINKDSNKNETFLQRKSINNNLNKNINNNRNLVKQLYINEIIPNNHIIFPNQIKKSSIRANNFNKYQKSPCQKSKDSKISLNSHSQKSKKS